MTEQTEWPTFDAWMAWPTADVAAWIRRQQPVVMGLPQDGTRRWYLAHRHHNPDAPDYLTLLIHRQALLHQMVFQLGMAYVLTPCYAKRILDRGEKYAIYALTGVLQLLDDPIYKQLVAQGVRIDFYGDYHELLDRPGYRHVLDELLSLRERYRHGDGPLLLLGFFADEPYETIGRLSVAFHQQHGRTPTRRELVQAYYGYDIPDLSLYISYGKVRIFSMPLLTTGVEDQYATVSPTPGVGERQMREILYDHLIARRTTEVDYEQLQPAELQGLIDHIAAGEGRTIGLGDVDPSTGKWLARG